MEKRIKFKSIVWAVIAALVLIFIIQNVGAVDINLLFWKISMSRSLLILFTIVIGMIAGWFLKGSALHRKRAKEDLDFLKTTDEK
jgi:uncharacterized integral membrane protein